MEAAAMRQRTLRAMELGGALAGAPAGGVSKPCAMLGRLLSISTLRGALPGPGRQSAASECSGGLRGLRGSVGWRDPTRPPTHQAPSEKVLFSLFFCRATARGGWVGVVVCEV